MIRPDAASRRDHATAMTRRTVLRHAGLGRHPTELVVL